MAAVAKSVDEARPPGIAKLSACGNGTEGHVLELAEMAPKDHVLESAEIAQKDHVLESAELPGPEQARSLLELVKFSLSWLRSSGP